jgi:uncharacterized protein YjbJ (UPF0337 family)
VKGFWAQGFLLMFKERIVMVMACLYLRLLRQKARGGDLLSVAERGKVEAIQILHKLRRELPE